MRNLKARPALSTATSQVALLLLQLFALVQHALATPQPKALAAAQPLPEATASPQYNVYAPFSGAIYVVGANGAQLSPASAAWCPNNAPQGCGNINVWNWCCPSGNTCAFISNGVVGCCPAGQQCNGGVSPGQITTVTVTQYAGAVVGATQTVQQVQTESRVIQTAQTTVYAPGASTNAPVCRTIIMRGQPIPTIVPGDCGNVLITSEGIPNAVPFSFGVLVALWSVFAVLGRWR